ncbi:MAG: endonuclease III [Legionellaceae bacterium]|nr:endonuclease III [Legionellaceae bacterium]
MNKEKSRLIFERFSSLNPEPKTELNYNSDFELLIAVILSAQATDISVNKSTDKLYKIANTPKKILDLGELGLKEYIKNIGLYNSKAANIIKTCEKLENKYQGKVPTTRDSLESLPGVGRKTANVVLNTAFGEPTIAVDTHIFRVGNRTGLAVGKTPLAVELGLQKRIEKKYLRDAHHWLVLHGRYICLARTPKCSKCPISDLCDFFRKSNKK